MTVSRGSLCILVLACPHPHTVWPAHTRMRLTVPSGLKRAMPKRPHAPDVAWSCAGATARRRRLAHTWKHERSCCTDRQLMGPDSVGIIWSQVWRPGGRCADAHMGAGSGWPGLLNMHSWHLAPTEADEQDVQVVQYFSEPSPLSLNKGH